MNPREIDALVAEKVMGDDILTFPLHDWHETGSDYNTVVCLRCDETIDWNTAGTAREEHLGPCVVEPNLYSSSIYSAWQVVNHIRTLTLFWSMVDFSDYWLVSLTDQDKQVWQVQDESLLVAICLTALKAVGVEIPA